MMYLKCGGVSAMSCILMLDLTCNHIICINIIISIDIDIFNRHPHWNFFTKHILMVGGG